MITQLNNFFYFDNIGQYIHYSEMLAQKETMRFCFSFWAASNIYTPKWYTRESKLACACKQSLTQVEDKSGNVDMGARSQGSLRQ